jgi:DNA-binding transcriptional MerR regulator
MKLPAFLLTVSVALNAALAGAVLLRPDLLPPAALDLIPAARRAPPAVAAPRPAAPRVQAAAAAPRLWPALDRGDLRALVAQLRAAGFPAAAIRAILEARIEGQFAARMNALAGAIENTPFWRPTPANSFTNPRFAEERSQIYRDRARLLRELLGDDFLATAGGDPTAAQRRRYGDLPKARIDLLARIEDDYAEMISQVRAATQGVTLPEDREKLALLEREKRADLAALLNARELEDYTMRSSHITSRLRAAMTLMNASEAEFRTIHRIREQWPDPYERTGGYTDYSEPYQQRQEREKQLAAQLAAALGPARYAELERAQHHEFQQLARLARRDGLGLDAAVRAYDLRAGAAAESMRIYENKTLTADQKLAAMTALAGATRNQLSLALGPHAGAAYAQSASWLGYIAAGRAISFSGTSTTIRSLPAAPPR